MRILVIGELCEDKFIYCKVERISPEAPVPVLNPITTVTNLGMAGNVYNNLKILCPESEIDFYHQKEKITKTRFVEQKSNHMFLRYDEGETNIEKFNQKILDKKTLKGYDFVVVSDYNKGFLSQDDLYYISKNSKMSFLDSKKILEHKKVKSFTFIKMNKQESENNHSILKNLDVLITLGKDGVKYKKQFYPSPKPQETIDVSGAGDTFISSFACHYFLYKDVEKSINFANEVSSEVVSKRGVALPSKKLI